MTIEGAIITLTNTASLLRDGTRYMKPEHEKQFREAYEMAIKALEQPEIIRCEDCANCQIDDVYHDYWCDGKKVWKDHFCGYAERRIDE